VEIVMFGLGRHPERTEADVSAEVAAELGFGGQSMVAPLKRVIVQQPAPPATADDWQRHGYARPVEHDAVVAEFEAFCAILQANGVEVIVQEPDTAGNLDSIFVYDPSILTDAGAVMARSGKELRRGEVERAAALYHDLDVPVIGHIEGPGLLEGGDAFWIDEHTLAVGIGYRTNRVGIDQLQTFIQPFDVDVVGVDLPHWHGPDECLHLLSLISPVAERTAVVFSPLVSTRFMQLLNELDWTLIDIPDDEFATQGTNILALAPGKVLILRENTGTRRLLETAGVEVLTYAGDHLSHNRQGGPTCLTRPLLRDVSAL
jgi:N-dimethylarginine dimethylaminohydrolase